MSPGAAGFVGSHFARVAHDAGLRVVALDDLSTSPRWPTLPEVIERIVGDVPRRPGDPSTLVASAGLAAEKLGWRPRRGLAEVVVDALRSRRT